jgi:very-short-patch-repair endonuclease
MDIKNYLNICKLNIDSRYEYDYSLLENDVKRGNIDIICKKHGKFVANSYHFKNNKSNCKKCTINFKIINEIEKLYPNRFNFDKFEYVNNYKHFILCDNDYNYDIRTTLRDIRKGIIKPLIDFNYIKNQSINNWGDKFEYLSIDNNKITLTCKEHQRTFTQSIKSHLLKKNGCEKCLSIKKYISSTRVKSKLKFIEDAINLCGDKFDYSKVDYINNKTPVIIIFNNKEYRQRPDSHLSGKSVELEWKKNMGQDEFIKKAIKKHGELYDYHLVEYKKTSECVNIICKKHGVFKQKAELHLKGNGCYKCKFSSGEKIISNFFEINNIKYESQYKFDDCKNINKLSFDFYLYDYNLCIEYDGSQHFIKNDFFGEDSFQKTIKNDMIKNNYCKENNINLLRIPYTDYKNIEKILYNEMKKYIKITQSEKNRKFIEKSINLWGYKYDYSKVNYIDSTTPVIIIYRGVEYNQTPKKHLSKKSCELNVNRLSDEEFIRRSIEIWGDRFSYENMNYINTYSKVNLFDKLTGFHIEVKASSHLNGNYPSDTKDIFIKKSELLYDNKYDYSNISFKNMTTKIKIICPEHGEFESYPYLHLTGRSGNICNKCSEFNTNKISKYLDKNNISYYRNHKFPDCKNIFQLPFDFYIPIIRTAIEFYGIQHFQPVTHFGGVDAFERLKINDKIKNDYCEDNYINLIRIRYDQIDDICRILWNNLKNYIKS